MKINEDSLRDFWDNINHSPIPIIGVPQEIGKGGGGGAENIFENIIAENFPNLRKETVTQVQEA